MAGEEVCGPEAANGEPSAADHCSEDAGLSDEGEAPDVGAEGAPGPPEARGTSVREAEEGAEESAEGGPEGALSGRPDRGGGTASAGEAGRVCVEAPVEECGDGAESGAVRGTDSGSGRGSASGVDSGSGSGPGRCDRGSGRGSDNGEDSGSDQEPG